MNLTQFQVKNLAKVPDVKVLFPNAGLVLVRGKNRQGKSSFIRGLYSMLNLTQPDGLLNKGKTTGYEEGILRAANGDEYVCRIDLDPKSKVQRLTLLMPDGRKVKSIGDAKNLLQYNQWTIEDFIDWGKTVDGARKQAQVVLSLFPEEVREKIESLSRDEKTAYENRTYLFRQREDKGGAVNQLKPSIEDVQEADSIPLLEGRMNVLKGKLDAFDGIKIMEGERGTVRKDIEYCNERLKQYLDMYRGCDAEIDRLKKLIEEQEAKKAQVAIEGNKVKQEKKMRAESILSIEEKLKAFNSDEKESLEAELDEVGKAMQSAWHSKTLVDTYNSTVKEYNELVEKHEEEDKRIATIRQTKKSLMTSGLPIDGLYIEDDLLFLESDGNLFRFNTNECSQSELMFKTVELFMATNKGVRVTLISRGESFDNDMLKALHEMGIENEYLYVMEYVSDGDFVVRCYEEVDNA